MRKNGSGKLTAMRRNSRKAVQHLTALWSLGSALSISKKFVANDKQNGQNAHFSFLLLCDFLGERLQRIAGEKFHPLAN